MLADLQIDVAMADFRGANWKRCVSYFTLRWLSEKMQRCGLDPLAPAAGPDWLKQGRWPRREKWPPWPSSRGQLPKPVAVQLFWAMALSFSNESNESYERRSES